MKNKTKIKLLAMLLAVGCMFAVGCESSGSQSDSGTEIIDKAVDKTVYLSASAPKFDYETEVISIKDKASEEDLAFSVKDGQIIMNKTDKRGDATLLIKTADGEVELDVCYATNIMSTAAEFALYASSMKETTDYAVMISDINMLGGTYIFGPTDNYRFNGVLDGRGHKLYNFSTYTGLGANCFTDGAVIKNIELNYTKTEWVQQYASPIIAGCAQITLENVYAEIEIDACSYPIAVFGNEFTEKTKIKNCVIKFELSSGELYEDCKIPNDSAIVENAYVIYDGETKKSGNYDITVVSTADEIEEIGGAFEKKSDGLYFYGKKV